MKERAIFSSEAMLCLTFTRNLPAGWTAYPETGAFDILLVRDADGVQVGIEAKLTLNTKVISQIVEDYYDPCHAGPDFRAILVPYGTKGTLGGICRLLGITVISMKDKKTWEATYYEYAGRAKFHPPLPDPKNDYWSNHDDWIDWAPEKRVELPDYVPDVGAGHSAPIRLTDWKVRAIKIAVLVEKNGFVTRADFNHIRLDHRRWLNPYVGWLEHGDTRGVYIAGPHLRTFKAQHPANYEQIAADFEKWAPK